MDLTGVKPLIISVGIGNWYATGVTRLERSLLFHGWPGDMLLWRDELPPGSPSHNDNPYAFKIFAFQEAFNRGYKNVMWLDSSFWAVKNPIELFDIIVEKGLYTFRTGYNCAQTCSDAVLEYAGFSRDEAVELPEYASGMVGINIDNPDGSACFESWKDQMYRSLFINSRHKSSLDSTDPRFIHARQDQSCWSMALHKRGIVIPNTDTVAYYGTNYDPERLIFFIQGC